MNDYTDGWIQSFRNNQPRCTTLMLPHQILIPTLPLPPHLHLLLHQLPQRHHHRPLSPLPSFLHFATCATCYWHHSSLAPAPLLLPPHIRSQRWDNWSKHGVKVVSSMNAFNDSNSSNGNSEEQARIQRLQQQQQQQRKVAQR